MRKLVLRKSESHKVPFYDLVDGEKVDTGIKLVIDYPTLEQQDELDDLHNQAMKPAIEKANELRGGKVLDEVADKEEIDRINLQAATYIDPVKFREYKRNLIRFALKGIEGSEFDDQFSLVDGEYGKEIEPKIFRELIANRIQSDLLYSSIYPEIEFTDSDKKK